MDNKIKWRVLIFPGGMENGLEIFYSLRYCKEIKLFSASAPIINHADYVFEKNFNVRDVSKAGWLEELNSIILENKIDLVFPANSKVIDAILPVRDKICAPVLLPTSEVVLLTRSKRATINALRNCLDTPRCYRAVEEIADFPVFVKPDSGYGSQGAEVIHNKDSAKTIDFESYVVQEYLPGREYTIDCFSNYRGEILFVGGRERSRIRMGTSMHAEAVSETLNIQFHKMAQKILEKLPISGPWFFQVREDLKGNLKLLEIDVRIAGTMCFNRCRGVNFPLLAIYDFFKFDVSVLLNKVPMTLDRALRNRFLFSYDYDAVYVDLDDTIVVHGKLNTELIQFLYQTFNKNKKIILLSKCLRVDRDNYLKSLRIYDLFDEIIWLSEDQFKSDFIVKERAIYIDDSFSQRIDVAKKRGIPVFDVSMVEGLLDDRY